MRGDFKLKPRYIMLYDTKWGIIYKSEIILLKPNFKNLSEFIFILKHIKCYGSIIILKNSILPYLNKNEIINDCPITWIFKFYTPEAIDYWKFYDVDIVNFEYPYDDNKINLNYKVLSIRIEKKNTYMCINYEKKDLILLIYIIEIYIELFKNQKIEFNFEIKNHKTKEKDIIKLYKKLINVRSLKIHYGNKRDLIKWFFIYPKFNNHDIITYESSKTIS